jgi:hypothetical protein
MSGAKTGVARHDYQKERVVRIMSSTKSKLRLIGAFALLMGLALAVGCRGFFVNPTVTSITVGPTGQSIAPGGQLQMTASGAMSDGSTPKNVTTQCFWSSNNTSAATVGEHTGLVTAAQTIANPPQTATITATYQALTPATATVSVCPSVTDLTITASPLTFPAQTATVITFTAMATFSGVSGSQNVVNEVTWNISNPAVLSSISGGSGTTSQDTTSGQSTQVTATLCSYTSQPVTITAQ